MGNDDSVVDAARVSFHKGAGEYSQEANEKLIRYLAKNNHWTPFGHTCLKFRIKAPIFVSRQLAKHQVGLVWNEVSRRYVSDEPEFYIPQLRKKAENVKQGSSDEVMPDMWTFAGIEHMKNLVAYYNSAIDSGMAPEVARAFLPQNMQTEWVWTGSLIAFSRVLNLRLDPHTQAESREIAQLLLPIIQERFPVSIKALLGESQKNE